MQLSFSCWLVVTAALAGISSSAAIAKRDSPILKVAMVRAPSAKFSLPILSREYTGVDINATTKIGIELIDTAAANGAKLVAFPEAWFPGYPKGNDDAWIAKWVENYIENSLVVGDSNWNQLIAAAARNKIFVALGYSEREGDAIYMAQAFIGPDGEVLIHRHKLRPSGGERSFWSDGVISDMKVVNTTYGRIGLLECWEHFHPSMTFPMHAQLEAIHIASWPYTPDYNSSDALFWESAEVNMAAASQYAVNGGAYTLVPSVGRAAIFGPQGLELAHIDATVSFEEHPLLYWSINTTGFTNMPSYNINGEESWGILKQIEDGWPASVPKEIGTYTAHKVNTIESLLALSNSTA